MHARDQSSIFSTGGKFRSDYGLLLELTHSYSSHPFLCALEGIYSFKKRLDQSLPLQVHTDVLCSVSGILERKVLLYNNYCDI